VWGGGGYLLSGGHLYCWLGTYDLFKHKENDIVLSQRSIIF